MAITPTNQGSLLAGVGLWMLSWATLFKLNKVPVLNRFFDPEKVTNWIIADNSNKSLTLIITELVNFSMHGITNPSGVIFALGGTIVNAFMVFIGLPIRQSYKQKSYEKTLLKGAAAGR